MIELTAINTVTMGYMDVWNILLGQPKPYVVLCISATTGGGCKSLQTRIKLLILVD